MSKNFSNNLIKPVDFKKKQTQPEVDYKNRLNGGYQAKLIDYEKEKQISELLESLGPEKPP